MKKTEMKQILKYAAVLAAGILLGLGIFTAGEKMAGSAAPEPPAAEEVKQVEEIRQNQPEETQLPEEEPQQQVQTAFDTQPEPSRYVSIETVKNTAVKDAFTSADTAEFLSIELDESGEVPVYRVVMETGNGYYRFVYEIGAESGLCRARTHYTGDNYIEEGNPGLIYDGDDDGTYPYNQYWEMGFEPSSQSFYPDMPVIDTFDYHEGYWDNENRIWVYPEDNPSETEDVAGEKGGTESGTQIAMETEPETESE